MDILQRICAGLDVHKDTVVACVRWLDDRDRVHTEVRTFGTTTPDLLQLLDWLLARQVPIVAMESTGVYWKPLFNLLEGRMKVLLNSDFSEKPCVPPLCAQAETTPGDACSAA